MMDDFMIAGISWSISAIRLQGEKPSKHFSTFHFCHRDISTRKQRYSFVSSPFRFLFHFIW